MGKTRHFVRKILPGSIAQEMDIQAGDEVLSINGSPIEDIFDYQFLIQDENIDLLLRKPDGEEWLLEIEKDEDEDLGLEFENSLMDEYRSCSNRCIFCFIDQMPPGMRETLYFKDDDSRLSFLQGNYVTLTNMKEHDLDRMIRYRLEPINISVHTTNPELRCRMLRNRFAGDICEKIRKLYRAEIEMNGQIVLCRGINDGPELDRTIRELSEFLPYLKSLSVVPVGLSRYREGLYPLEAFDGEDAGRVLETIHRWQDRLYEKWGRYFVHASDEWYLLAGQPLPREERYDGYPQLENGVGMLRLLFQEVKEDLEKRTGDQRKRKISLATGVLAAPWMEKLGRMISRKFPGVRLRVCPVANRFFGEQITVSGLLTGQDLKGQLTGQDLGECLLLPCNMLRDGENVFLDDMTVEELEEALGIPVQVTDEPGSALVSSVLGETEGMTHRRRQSYEQTDCCHCGPSECGKIHSV